MFDMPLFPCRDSYMSDGANKPQWFNDLLKAAIAKAGNRSNLSARIGASHVTIMGWEGDSWPRLDKFLALLAYVGGDVSRCLPSYDPRTQPQKAKDAELSKARAELRDLHHRLELIREIINPVVPQPMALVAADSVLDDGTAPVERPFVVELGDPVEPEPKPLRIRQSPPPPFLPDPKDPED